MISLERQLRNDTELLHFIGKGGMAEVYKVWDEERSVNLAMKVSYADYAEDKVFLRRFSFCQRDIKLRLITNLK